MSGVVIAGDTSGTITLQAPAVSGNTVLTLPATTGNVAIVVGNNSNTVYLTSNVAINNTANFFDVVSTGSIGGAGQVFQISGNIVVRDTAGAANFVLQVTDGTNIFASSALGTASLNFEVNWSFSVVVVLTGAATIKVQARDTTSVNGQALATTAVTGGTANKASYITYTRIL